MCCGQTSRPSSQKVKQTEVQQVAMQAPKKSDSGNPVNALKTNNVDRANEVNRNNYHSQHFGLGR